MHHINIFSKVLHGNTPSCGHNMQQKKSFKKKREETRKQVYQIRSIFNRDSCGQEYFDYTSSTGQRSQKWRFRAGVHNFEFTSGYFEKDPTCIVQLVMGRICGDRWENPLPPPPPPPPWLYLQPQVLKSVEKKTSDIYP